MLYSVACSYGIRAVVRLASLQARGGYATLSEIATQEGLPPHFVGKVLQVLVHAGLVESAKGRGGGFTLSRAADKIHLREIVNAIDGPMRIARCPLGMPVCDDEQDCPQHQQWATIRTSIDALLDNTSLSQLSKNCHRDPSR